MKTPRTTSSYSFSSSYYQNLWENFAFRLEESSKQENKSTKTHPKIVQRENGRCEICYEIAKKKMKGSSELQNGEEEDKQEEVMEENVIVMIDDNEEKRKEPLEKKVIAIGDEIKGKKMDVMEENVALGIEKDEAVEVKRKKFEEIMGDNNGEVKEGKIVIIDYGVDMEDLLGDSDADESGEGNDHGGRVVRDLMEVQNEDMFSDEINGEGNQFPGWNQWKFEAEQEWYCSYPFWETENGGLNFCEVEPPANDWVVSLWQL